MTTDIDHALDDVDAELERLLRATYASVVPRLVSSDATPRFDTIRPRPRPRQRLLVAAACLVVVVAGVAAIQALRTDEGRSSERGSDGPSVIAAPDRPVGIFPAGDATAVIAAGYDSPVGAVSAYLGMRVDDPTNVPGGTTMRAHVATEAVQSGADRAFVGFSIDAPGGGGDGVAEAVRVTIDERSGWAVVAAFASVEVPAMELVDGNLRGAVWSWSGDAVVAVRDAANGAPLADATFPKPRSDGDGAPPGTPVALDGVTADDVAVLVWQVDPDSGRADGSFGDFLVTEGSAVVTGFRSISPGWYAPWGGGVFADPTVSSLDELGNGETAAIVDEGDLSITASRDVGGHTYCVAVRVGGVQRRDCWPLSRIGAGDARNELGGVWYRIVPDSVTVTSAGRPVAVTSNVWYARDEGDGLPGFEFSDGTVTQTEGDVALPLPETTGSEPDYPVYEPVTPTSSVAPEAIAAADNLPTLFPVLPGNEPADAMVSAPPVLGSDSDVVELAIGRRDGDAFVDTVTIDVHPSATPRDDAESDLPVTVFGEPATLRTGPVVGDDRALVRWGTGPEFVAFGRDPLAFLESLDSSPFAVAIAADGSIAVDVGALPVGFEVLAAPQRLGDAGYSAGVVGGPGQEGPEVFVQTQSPLASLVAVGDIVEVDIGGVTGWAFVDGGIVAWPAGDGTYASLKTNDGRDLDATVTYAESVAFVPFDQWLTTYDVVLPEVES